MFDGYHEITQIELCRKPFDFNQASLANGTPIFQYLLLKKRRIVP